MKLESLKTALNIKRNEGLLVTIDLISDALSFTSVQLIIHASERPIVSYKTIKCEHWTNVNLISIMHLREIAITKDAEAIVLLNLTQN